MCLLQELTGIENSVIGLGPDVTIHLPSRLYTWPLAHESSITISRSPDQSPGYGIDAVLKALSPIENPVGRDSHPMPPFRQHARVNVSKVHWTRAGIGNNAKVVPNREYWIKCSQSVCIRVIPAGDIGLEAKPRL